MALWPYAEAEAQQHGRDGEFARFATLLASVAAVIAVVVIAGWTLGVPGLQQLAPGLAVMKLTSAVALLALAATWLPYHRLQVAALALVVVLGVVSLAEHIAGSDLDMDQVAFAGRAAVLHPGRMAASTAVCVIVLALARFAGLVGRDRIAEIGGLVVVILASIALFGYVYHVPDMYAIGASDAMAPNSAFGLSLLSVAVLASVPRGALVWMIRGTGPGPLLLRRLLPVAFLGLPLLGVLSRMGERWGWFGANLALALVVVGSTLLVASFAWLAARDLSVVDGSRLQAIADLRSLANDLEDRVEQRVAQIEAHHARIAVLEDRERIASDLHDLVVQQLFAAGMHLQGVATVSDSAAVSRRVDAAVDAIDSAIADLRASIYRLGGGEHESDLDAATRHVVEGASLGLGFAPTLAFDGPIDVALEAQDDLVAVLREALSNVARHAHATCTDVCLAVTRDDVILTIADNGVGIGRVERESGTGHMRARAAQYGGTCEWFARLPSGTVVEWRVPRGADGRLRPVRDGLAASI